MKCLPIIYATPGLQIPTQNPATTEYITELEFIEDFEIEPFTNYPSPRQISVDFNEEDSSAIGRNSQTVLSDC